MNFIRKSLLFLCSLLVFASCTKEKKLILINTVDIEAPFGTVSINYPDFQHSPKYLISDFGAVQGNLEKTTRAIKEAIAAAHKNKGGIVVIPEGEWLTGKIELKSNVNLHITKNAVLLFSKNPQNYLPAVHSAWEGMECYNYAPLIYAYKATNVAVTGKGKLKAEMDIWEKWFARPQVHLNALKKLYKLSYQNVPVEERQMVDGKSHFRPQFIQFNRSSNILIESIHIQNSPFWVLHPYMCKNVVIRDVHINAHGHNNDGVDPEMSQNVLIENSVFDQGDDAIAIKAGRNQEAWRLNTPTKNVIIRNCLVKNGHQLVAIGSELSGGIENVFIENCEVEDGAKLNHLLFIKTNERRGGYVKNIFMKNVKAGKIDKGILGIETDVLYQWRNLVPTYERKLTPISNIWLENVISKEVQFISNLQGEKELPISNVHLKNVSSDIILKSKYLQENIVGFQTD